MAKQPSIFSDLLGEFYVYELVDPRCKSVFYVGKGTGDRVKHHVLEYKRNSNRQSNQSKISRIKDIIDSNNDVVERIVGNFRTQEEAIEYEAELIAHYGIENLTNIMAKGTVYKRYPFLKFTETVRLAVSMLARIKDQRKIPDSASFIYDGILKEYEHIKRVGGRDFLDILNNELDMTWKGARSCLI